MWPGRARTRPRGAAHPPRSGAGRVTVTLLLALPAAGAYARQEGFRVPPDFRKMGFGSEAGRWCFAPGGVVLSWASRPAPRAPRRGKPMPRLPIRHSLGGATANSPGTPALGLRPGQLLDALAGRFDLAPDRPGAGVDPAASPPAGTCPSLQVGKAVPWR
jgi:hypothetical protein